MINTNELIGAITERSGDLMLFVEEISEKLDVSKKEILYGMLGIESLSINAANLIADELNLNISEYGKIFFNQ